MNEAPISACKARQILGQLRGGRKIAHATLRRLIQECGLPVHRDPFGGPRPIFFEREIRTWFRAQVGR